FVINGKFVKSNTVNILTAVKQKTNPLNINQIQQNIKDKFRLINSNNDISNSYNDLSINFKIIKYISDIMNQNSIPTLESKYIEKQLKSSTISKEIKNETKVEKQIASNKKKDIITQTDDLPITGIDNNLTIVVLGGLLILLGLIHAFNILRRRKK
ncbi:TPA: isopeptide-forming domain-containing fimbrial protein, partial [Staphylococcus aureus]